MFFLLRRAGSGRGDSCTPLPLPHMLVAQAPQEMSVRSSYLLIVDKPVRGKHLLRVDGRGMHEHTAILAVGWSRVTKEREKEKRREKGRRKWKEGGEGGGGRRRGKEGGEGGGGRRGGKEGGEKEKGEGGGGRRRRGKEGGREEGEGGEGRRRRGRKGGEKGRAYSLDTEWI